jgi:hypothetical protein
MRFNKGEKTYVNPINHIARAPVCFGTRMAV